MTATMTARQTNESPPTVGGIILSNFDLHQKRGEGTSKTRRQTGTTGAADADARASRIRQEVEAYLLNDALSSVSIGSGDADADGKGEERSDAAREEVTSALIQCLDGALAAVASGCGKEKAAGGKKAAAAGGGGGDKAPESDWSESVERTFDLAAAVGCGSGDGHAARALVERAAMFADVSSESVRVQVCNFLGVCVRYLQRYDETAGNARGGKTDNAVSSFLSGNGNDGEKDWRQECLELVSTTLIPRVTDKSQAVRAAAIRACGSFFSDDDDDEGADGNEEKMEIVDAVTGALLIRLAHDTSFANRCAAVQSVPVREDTIPFIIERVRDVKEKVRVEALDVLQRKVDVHDLTEEQRVDVLRSGLTDRCSATYEAAAGMVCSGWMKALKFDPIGLLRLLDPVNNESICEGVVRAVFAAARDDETLKASLKHLSNPEVRAYKEGVLEPISIQRTEDEAALDPATVFFVRVLCDTTTDSQNMSASEQADIIAKFLPDVPVLCEVLQKHLGRLIGSIRSSDDDDEEAADFEDSECFICLQLLQLAKCADLQEEGSRRHLVSIIYNMLVDAETPDDLIEGCVRAMAVAHDTESQFLQTISEIVSDIGDNMKQGSVPDEEDITVLRQIRTVSTLSIVLENVSGNTTSSGILNTFSDHIVPAVTSNNAIMREAGVSCLGKFALLMEEDRVMDDYKPLLIQVASRNEEKIEVRAQALLALCDLALLFDGVLTSSSPNDADDEGDLSFVFLLSEMLCHSKSAVVVVAAEIAAKLLFAGKLHDHPSMVAHLIVIFFDKDLSDPSKNDDVGEEVKEIGNPIRLQQILSVFFPAYSLKSKEGRQTLLDSIKPLLTIVNEKLGQKVKGRKAASWPIAKMVEYVCSTVDLGDEQEEDNEDKADETNQNSPADEEVIDASSQEGASSTLVATIAISEVLTELSANMTTTYLRALCKMLGILGTYIDIEGDDPQKLALLKKCLDDLAMIITDDPAIRAIEQLHEVLEDVDEEDDGFSEGEENLVEAMENTDLNDEAGDAQSVPEEGGPGEESDSDIEGENAKAGGTVDKDDSSSRRPTRIRRQLADVN